MNCTRGVAVAAVAAFLAGCGGSANEAAPTAAPKLVELGASYDASRTGTVSGRVVWSGDVPTPPDVQAAIPTGVQAYTWAMMPAPFAPKVHPETKGVSNALVSLRGIDPARSKPWDRPAVRITQRDHQIRIQQGDGPERPVGVARLGDEVTMTSADPVQHMLRGRGAATFTLPFPESNQPLTRRFDREGIVELSSGAGMAWMAADLVIATHPYHAVTDDEGRFTLENVPEGSYELVCRVRNWRVAGRDRNTETGITIRHRYATPVEKTVRVTVVPESRIEMASTFTTRDFDAAK